MAGCRQLYIRSGDEALFAMFDPAIGEDLSLPAVLVCAPWGWEETASYRCRRMLSRALAEGGHSTLRFNMPSVGDSSGAPGDPGRVEAWIAAVTNAATWLRHESGRSRLAVLGLGLGGLIALAAAGEGAPIDEMALWAVPGSGRRFLRETRAFARLQGWGQGRGGESSLPEGWIEAGGFVLSAETVDALQRLEMPERVPGRLQRVLIMDRDGVSVDGGLGEALARRGVKVTSASGEGWQGMVYHPEHATFPSAGFERIAGWLAGSWDHGAAVDSGGESPDEAAELLLELREGSLIERPLDIEQPFGRSFAILAEPVGEGDDELCVVFLNAGAVRHIGPNRNWVENARRWAARGVPTVRVDLEGIGEADGDRSAYPGVAGFYDEVYAAQVGRVLDSLERRGIGRRFVCVGLCSGAYWSLQMADRDARVAAGVLLNSGAIVWHSGLGAERALRLLAEGLLSRRSWAKLLRREVDLLDKARLLARVAAWRLRRALGSLWRHIGGRPDAPPEDERLALFARLHASGKRIAMGFCSNEPVLAELRSSGILERFDEWPNIVLDELPGEDHALGPIDAQRGAAALIDRELELARRPYSP